MNETTKLFIEKMRLKADCLGIILFGSWARGNARPDSDVDLIVLLAEGFERSVETIEGTHFEITYTTPSGIVDFWEANPDDCAGLWEYAKVLYDKDGTVSKLETVGERIRVKGKQLPSRSELSHIAFDAEDQLKAINWLKNSDPATARLLLEQRALGLLSSYFDLQPLWTPAPKQMLATLSRQAPDLHRLFVEFYVDAISLADRIEIVSAITAAVFQKRVVDQ